MPEIIVDITKLLLWHRSWKQRGRARSRS